MKKVELKISGMKCSKCSARLEKVIKNLDGVKDASVNLENATADVEYDETICNTNVLAEAVADAGFECKI